MEKRKRSRSEISSQPCFRTFEETKVCCYSANNFLAHVCANILIRVTSSRCASSAFRNKSLFFFSKSFEEKLVQIKYKNILNGVCCSTELSKLFIYKYVSY